MTVVEVHVWGPATWTLLEAVAQSYAKEPDAQDRVAAHRFLNALAAVLPCKLCSDEFALYLKSHAPFPSSGPFDGREALARFVTDAHNSVNRRLGKREWTYDQARRSVQSKVKVSSVGHLWYALVIALLGAAAGLAKHHRDRCYAQRGHA